MEKKQSSYIFLARQDKDKIRKANAIRISKRFSSYITDCFPDAQLVEQFSSFREEYSVKDKNMADNCQTTFTINDVSGNAFLDITVSGDDRATVIACLEFMQEKLEKSDIQNNYTMIVSYDAISEYYCNLIYPELNRLERNLRKLLFNTYVVNFGRNYYQATISQELQNKIKSVIQAGGNAKEKETMRLQNFFYSFEFSDIQNLLFTPNWTETDSKKKEDFLSKNEELSKLSDEELWKAFPQLRPKSDWERFFSAKIDKLNMQKAIEYIRKQRNQIAHCKFFYKKDYNECSKVIGDLDRAIISAIKMTEEKDFLDKYLETGIDRIGNILLKYSQHDIPRVQQISTITESIQNTLLKLSEISGQYNTEFEKAIQTLATFCSESLDENSACDDDNDNKKTE